MSLGLSSYSIREPVSNDEYTTVRVHVHRQGDLTEPAQVRISTRDRSAVSGIDYMAKSAMIEFFPGLFHGMLILFITIDMYLLFAYGSSSQLVVAFQEENFGINVDVYVV